MQAIGASLPSLIVEVRWGPQGGRKVVVAHGSTLRVGRSEVADLVVPHDSQLSSAHFAITWGGDGAFVQDLRSAQGTTLNGERVTHGKIESGDWIRAGDTIFSVYIEGSTPPRRRRRSRQGRFDEATARRRKLREEAYLSLEPVPQLFAVLDAARSERILELLHESIDESRSLYEGLQGDALAEVAPYLVRFLPRSKLLHALVSEGWGERWGVFLTSRASFKEVRTQLRRHLLVEREKTGDKLYFRFYDPGVLRVFLPTSSARQRADLFGPIDAFLIEAEDASIHRFTAASAEAAVFE